MVTVNSQVNVVPVWPPRHEAAVVPMEALPSEVVDVPIFVLTGDVYWLKPVPVKVIVCSGAPARTAAAVDRLDAVTVGAISEGSPMPIAPVAKYVAPLPGDVLVTVRLHSRFVAAVTAAPLTIRVSVIEVVPPTVPVEPRVTLAQPARVSVALEEKPLPVTVIGVVAAIKATADGVTSLISLPLIVKTEPVVTEPPSGFVTVTV